MQRGRAGFRARRWGSARTKQAVAAHLGEAPTCCGFSLRYSVDWKSVEALIRTQADAHKKGSVRYAASATWKQTGERLR
jgi:hypothetical protein